MPLVNSLIVGQHVKFSGQMFLSRQYMKSQSQLCFLAVINGSNSYLRTFVIERISKLVTLVTDEIILLPGCSPLVSTTVKFSPKSQKICLKTHRE